MAIFSRRVLQKLINENSQFLLRRQTEKHVRELNSKHEDPTLAYEWEVVLLNSLNKVGRVSHEKSFGGPRTADIYFESLARSQAFLADITAVSDRGLDASNPYRALTEALYQRVRRCGLQPNFFSVHVGATYAGPTYKGGPKVLLKVPGRARLPQIIFNKPFQDFMCRILGDPDTRQVYLIKTADAEVRILYTPGQQFAMGTHPAYKEIYSRTENAIYQTLERKASQLVQTGYQGHLGIFLCDGGCSAFKKRSAHGLSYSLEEIIRSFLFDHEQIGFIVAVTTGVGQDCAGWDRGGTYHTCIFLYISPMLDEAALDLTGTLHRLLEVVPTPESDPVNALHLLESERWNRADRREGVWSGAVRKSKFLRGLWRSCSQDK